MNEVVEFQAKGKEPIWPRSRLYSDQIANGDHFDDAELEDEEDPWDMIVSDNDRFDDNYRVNKDKIFDWWWEHRDDDQFKKYKHPWLIQ
jgi:hypothetical protein